METHQGARGTFRGMILPEPGLHFTRDGD